MTEVTFPNINKRVLRNGTQWGSPIGIITEKTMSGKSKRRPSLAQSPKTFTVVMRFSLEEYEIFENWWENVCRKGLYPFRFPRIDGMTGEKLYQFTSDGAPQYNNPSGDKIDVTMGWEEVR